MAQTLPTTTAADPFAAYDDADIARARVVVSDLAARLDRYGAGGELGDPIILHSVMNRAELALKDLLRIIDHRAQRAALAEAAVRS
jgi:hypothetical protein